MVAARKPWRLAATFSGAVVENSVGARKSCVSLKTRSKLTRLPARSSSAALTGMAPSMRKPSAGRSALFEPTSA